MSKLTGKVALVTGASKGIGASIAKHLAAAGASVVVNYSSSKEGADRVVSEIEKQGGKAVALKANVAKKAEVIELFAGAKKTFGRLDILINNAGVYEFAPLAEITEEHFHRIFDINVLGLILASQEAAKHFDDAGGSIVNISSIVSTYAPPGSTVYSGTKGAVDTITKVLAKEFGPRKIRVNAVAPGMVDTEGAADLINAESGMVQQYEKQSPSGRIGKPEDIATAAVFLATEDASWVTGEIWTVSGGVR